MSRAGDSRLDGAASAPAAGEPPGADVASQGRFGESTLLLRAPTAAEPTPHVPPQAPARADDLPRLQPGETLAGRFTVVRFIAQGGMGAVYAAYDAMLRAQVALKVIRGRFATDAAAMERFRREVLLARRVSHPSVCRVYELYDAVTLSGVPVHFLTMELLDGETLGQRVARKGRLATEEALPLARQMCQGLAAAHAEGVIHRDFKSSNVMLVPRSSAPGDPAASSHRVAITDFGIALAIRLENEEQGDGPLTGDAGVLGTPEYMSPEQVSGGTVTPATDVYSLGVVLYEMVTGKRPFTGDTPLIAASKRLTEAPPHPEASTPGLDARWSAAILRCLSREPERRFKSVLDIVPALERPRRRWRRSLLWASIGAAGLVLALLLFGRVRLLPGVRPVDAPSRATLAAVPRPAVAILGVTDELGSAELAWLPTAVSEVLGRELAAADTSLRVIPTDRVAHVRRSLGVSEGTLAEGQVRSRLQGLLAANFLVYGRLKPPTQGSSSVGLSVKLLDAASGRELLSLEEDLGEAAGAFADRMASVSAALRTTLGVSLSKEESEALSASREHNLPATRFYAQGIDALRKSDYENARSDFEAALAADGSFVEAQRRLGETWEHQGNRKRAREAAERTRNRPGVLTPRQLAETDARILSLGPDPSKATEARQALFDARPDDLELGLSLMDEVTWYAPKTTSAIFSRLREQSATPVPDIRLELAEAEIAWRVDGNPQHAAELLARTKARAQALGARSEVAAALYTEAEVLSAQRHGEEALARYQESADILTEVGELDDAVSTKEHRADLLQGLVPTSDVLKALEECATLLRRLGDHGRLHDVLLLQAQQLLKLGDVQPATSKVSEAQAEWEAIEETPGPYYWRVKGQLAQALANLDGVRDAIRLVRMEPHMDIYALPLEIDAFRAQDRLQEARVSLEKQKALQGEDGGAARTLCELSCDEGHPREGLECLANHPPAGGVGTAAALGRNVQLAKCRYLAGDLTGAEAAAQEAKSEAARLGDYAQRILANAYLMRSVAARGEPEKAMANLRADLSDVKKKHALELAFEVELALGEVEFKAGNPLGRTRLRKLEQEARSKEFFRIARLSREALDGRSIAVAH